METTSHKVINSNIRASYALSLYSKSEEVANNYYLKDAIMAVDMF